jgi:hypothetical protein
MMRKGLNNTRKTTYDLEGGFMKGVTMLNNGRFISDHGPGTTCYYDSRHKLIKTRLSGGGFAELIKELQMDGSLLDAIQQPIKRDQSARHQQAEMQDLRGRYESLPPARETPSNGKSGLWAPCKTTIFLSLKSNFLRSSGHREIFVLASLVIVVESFPRRER